MKKNLIRYKVNPIDYEATITQARKMKLKVELGGGRPTKAGDHPNAQIILNLKSLKSKILISRTGKIEIYYPSHPNLKRCLKILEKCCVTLEGNLSLECESPIDPLDFAFEYNISFNWESTGLKCAKAKVNCYQWLDLDTGEYLFKLPNKSGAINWPIGNYVYQGYCPIEMTAVDKDDENGNRIITAEKLMSKMVNELKRMVKENPRLKIEDKK